MNIVTSISTNPLPVALSDTDNAVLDTIDAVLDTIKIDTEAIETAVEIIDNVVFVDDAAFTLGTSSGIMMMGFAGTQSVNANDAGAIAMETDGAIHIHDGGNIITVDGTVDLGATDNAVLDSIVTQLTAGATTLVKLEDVANAPADAGVPAMAVRKATPVDLSGTDGDYEFLQMDVGRLWVSATIDAALPAGTNEIGKLAAGVAEIGNVQNGGTFVVQEDGAALTALQLIDDSVFADDAPFTLTSSKVVMAGAIRDDSLATMTAIEGDAVPLRVGSTGALHVTGGVTSQIPGTGATNAGKAQDVAVGADDVGVAMLVKRDDEEAAVTPVDGDYVVPTCDKFGKLKVTELPDATSVIKYAVVNVASSGDNTIQAAAGVGIKIRVLSVFLVAAGTVVVRFESAAGGTALTGEMPLVANSGFVLPFNPGGWFETADNALLNLELGGAVGVDGCVTYVEV